MKPDAGKPEAASPVPAEAGPLLADATAGQQQRFARAFDLFWLIEPNFKDAARNLHFSWGILEYAAVPVAMAAFWVAYFCTQLKARPLVQTNDPHLAEILEAEHAHA